MSALKYINVRGTEVEQAFQKMPFLDFTYTEFEKNYEVNVWHQWSKDTWPHVPLALCAIYLVAIFGGKHYMKDHEPAGNTNRAFLAAWNLLLSTFSFMGMFRTVPHLMHNIFNNTLQENVCQVSNHNQPCSPIRHPRAALTNQPRPPPPPPHCSLPTLTGVLSPPVSGSSFSFTPSLLSSLTLTSSSTASALSSSSTGITT